MILYLAGKFLSNLFIFVTGGSAKKIELESEIDEYIKIFSEKFILEYKKDPEDLKRYQFYWAYRWGKIIGGFVVHCSLDSNRSLQLAPQEFKNQFSTNLITSELCMLWKHSFKSRLNSAIICTIGMNKAAQMGEQIMVCAAKKSAYQSYKPYVSNLIFEGYSQKLNSEFWILTVMSKQYYINYLMRFPDQLLARLVHLRKDH